MFNSKVTILLLAALVVSCLAQHVEVPDCASNCTETYWGSIGDTYCEGSTEACLCVNSDWLSAYACCLDAAPCSSDDEATARSFLTQACEAANVSDAGDATCSSGASPSSAASSTIGDSAASSTIGDSAASSTTSSSRKISSPSTSKAASSQSQSTSATYTLAPWTPQAAIATSSSTSSGAPEATSAASKSSLSAPVSVGIGIGGPVTAFALAALVFTMYRCVGRRDGEEEEGLIGWVEYGGRRMPVVRSLIKR